MQRDEAYSLAEAREEARTRTMVLARRLENDYRRREVEYQRQMLCFVLTVTTPRLNSAIVLS